MKRYSLIVAITSILIGVYSFYISVQVTQSLVQVKAIKQLNIEMDESRQEELTVALHYITGASQAASINTKIIITLALFNLVICTINVIKQKKNSS